MTKLTLTLDGFAIGQRVQMHPATNAWIRGDRYGEIIKLTSKVHVKLDRSGRTLRCAPANVMPI
jgi:hypothetical protein